MTKQSKMKLKLQKLNPDATLPSYAHPGDAGLDLHTIEDHEMQPKERHVFKTGIALEIPEGYVGLIWDKSGLAGKHGLHHFAGVIDSTYRGEIQVVIYNSNQEPYQFKKGDKIAQLLIQKMEKAELEEVTELSPTTRADQGWGSSGR